MIRKLAIYACMLVFGLICTMQASEVRMIADPSVPAATGKAHVDKDKNRNLRLKLEDETIWPSPAPSRRRDESYVVWVQPRGREAENQEYFRVKNDLEGSFENAVPNADFEVFVTAEDNPAAQMPSGPKLLRAEVQP